MIDDLNEAKAWHTRPLPEPAELRRVTELLAGLKNSIRQEIQFREQDQVPADLLEQKLSKAAEDIEGEILAWLGQGRLAAYLETSEGLERLPNGPFWVYGDGDATPHARRVLAEGIAGSNRRTGLAGTVKFRASDFEAFAEAYRVEHGVGSLYPGAGRFWQPVWDLRDVFGWVLDRDPFGRINSETGWKSAASATRFYTDMPRTEFDRLADQTLLQALQRGELTGYSGTSPIPRDFWINKSELTLRACVANFYREEVLAIWPDPRTRISRAPPPITPLRGSRAPAVVELEPAMDRSPQWTIWNNIAEVRVFEAVALSLNIDPRKVRHNPHAWMAGKRMFNEDQEFNDRFLVAERNLAKLGVINSVAAHYEGQEPIIRLNSFVGWALRIGWDMPAELSATIGAQEPEFPTANLERTSAQEELPISVPLKPQRIANSTKRDAVLDFVAKHYPEGIPPGVTQKHLAREIEAETKVRVDERTVRRALGGR